MSTQTDGPRIEWVTVEETDLDGLEIMVKLRSGVKLFAPLRVLPGLECASQAQAGEFAIAPTGRSIAWKSRGLKFQTPRLIAHLCGLA